MRSHKGEGARGSAEAFATDFFNICIFLFAFS